MRDEFTRIEKYLYARHYQKSDGDWSTRHYAIFTCWDGVRRSFPLGDSLDDARDEIGRLRTLNKGRFEFDKEKRERQKAQKAMTLSAWLDKYIDLMKDTPSAGTIKAYCQHLKRLSGSLPLEEVTKVRILEYKKRRLGESVVRHGEQVKDMKVKGATVNREVSCLIAALNLAASEGLCEEPPRIKKEHEAPRERTLTDDEYKALLDVSPRWLQRVIIGANEAALDRGVLLALTWEEIKPGLIVTGRAKTRVKQRVGISSVLAEVLEELRAEHRRVPNTERRVFTRDGKPVTQETLRWAFEKACQDAKIEDFQFRDFRHCARTRWAAANLPYEVAEGGLGHKIPGMAGRYTNLTDEHVRQAFREMFTRCLQGNQTTTGSNQQSSVNG